MNLYQYNIMEIKEIIDPLDKLKIRPNPKKFIKSVFFIDADKEDIKECTFTDKRENFKVNRTEILKNIMESKNKPFFFNLPAKNVFEPHVQKPIKKIMKPSIIEESSSESESSSSSDTEKKQPNKPQPRELKEQKGPKEQKEPKEQKGPREPKEPMENDSDLESSKGSENDIKGVVVRDKGKYLDLLNPDELIEGIPKRDPIHVKTSNYYLNNRKLFIEKLQKLFHDYKNKSEKDNNLSEELLLHQRIAREYLNVYTPYRGLLLYYGLGTGKSATAVAIAEGLKSTRRIYLMIPASLETNFINEIMKFGDQIYRKKQHWVFVSTEGQPENIKILANILNVSEKSVKTNKGAWLMNLNKPSNFDSLNTKQKNDIDDQLIEMIKSKYNQINYNANNLKRVINQLSDNNSKNPFDNSVVIVDEAHKLVSLIVNKLNKSGKISDTPPVAIQIYNLLMTATNARIVLLTGTPIVNYPNEIAVLFNILRGTIKTWNYDLTNYKKIDRDYLLDLFYKNNLHTYDYVSFNNGKIQITRNPFGFVNEYKGAKGGTRKSHNKNRETRKIKTGGVGEFQKYDGVTYDETGNISDADFENSLSDIFIKNNIQVSSPTIELNKALPDTLDKFNEKFLNIENIENPKFKDRQDIVFIKRILGLSSYYRVSDNDPNLPKLRDKTPDIQYCPMSDYQFAIYRDIRKKEVEQQKKAMKIKSKKGDEVYEISSTYRVYSRACCNFAFPTPPGRPYPSSETTANEDEIDGEIANPIDILIDGEALPHVEQSYKDRITVAMNYLKENEQKLLSSEGLELYSPKFLKILQNIKNPEHIGLHLVYSQFRTLEGIGILQYVLEANGFVQFKIKKSGGDWNIQQESLIPGKPRYVLYTGTEDQEERELVRNIYNGDWDDIPSSLKDQLLQINANNLYGEIIKVIMITSSAAEGINLRNTQYVHLVEPYWHMVRLDQVIGRARRYQSHIKLPKKYQFVKVFLYLASFSKDQQYKIKHTIGEGELKSSDISKRDPNNLFTTDQTLYEMSDIKIKISNEILNSVKSASVDCQLHHKSSDSFTCYDFGNVQTNEFSYKPTIEEDILEQGEDKKAIGRGVELNIRGNKYYANLDQKNDPNLKQFNLYSDKYLKTKVGIYDKVEKKLIL